MARFDCAAWRPVRNHGGPMTAQLGLILHHAVANGSLYDWFDNPASGVSATFWVSQSGVIEQYVDSATTAWHAMQMNDTYCGVETEGCASPPHADPMSQAMVDALARLYAEGHRRHGWPLALAEADGQPGFGYHRMGVATACPCQIRVDMRAEILTRAGEDVDRPTPIPEPEEEDPDMILISNDTTGAVSVFDGTQRFYVNNSSTLNALKEAGLKVAKVHGDWYNKIPTAPGSTD